MKCGMASVPKGACDMEGTQLGGSEAAVPQLDDDVPVMLTGTRSFNGS